MPNFMSIIKNIMRDLVNEKNLPVSFSMSYKYKEGFDRETREKTGKYYLAKSISFWSGDYWDAKQLDEIYYFKNDPDFLKFLNAFRQLYEYYYNNNYKCVVGSVISEAVSSYKDDEVIPNE